MSDAFDAADDALATCQERVDAARNSHASLGTVHDELNSFHGKLSTAIADGDRDTARSLCDGMGNSLRRAQATHKDLGSAHDGLQRSLEAARLAVQGARDAGDGAYADPTANMAKDDAGGMTTAGPSGNGNPPRDYSPDAIHERDRRQAVDAAYRARIEELRRRH